MQHAHLRFALSYCIHMHYQTLSITILSLKLKIVYLFIYFKAEFGTICTVNNPTNNLFKNGDKTSLMFSYVNKQRKNNN